MGDLTWGEACTAAQRRTVEYFCGLVSSTEAARAFDVSHQCARRWLLMLTWRGLACRERSLRGPGSSYRLRDCPVGRTLTAWIKANSSA